MKTVLFCCYGLGIGGIEKCLVNLINAMPEEDFAVDLLLMNPKYSFLPSIQRAVTQLDSFCYVMNTTDTYREIPGARRSHKKFSQNGQICFVPACSQIGVKILAHLFSDAETV